MSEKDGRAMHPHGPHTDRGPLSTGNCAQWPVPLGSAALSRTGEAVLEDIDMKRTFERIVSSIHLDDDAEDHVAPLSKDRGIVPDLNSPASSSTFSFTPRSSPNHGYATTPSLSPSRRMVNRGTNFDPPIMGSPLPLSTKSFLDDDWLRERVRVDSNMALVAGGLVRSSSTPPASSAAAQMFAGEGNGGGGGGGGSGLGGALASGMRSLPSAFGSNRPPKDYICKLCSVPGHWLKDCHLFEPRDGPGAAARGSGHTRTSSMSSLPTGTSSSVIGGGRGQPPPPGNYICRLCGVPGHWIEQCIKFQPKNGTAGSAGKMAESRLGVPPSNYVCNLCHQPGHWIQQCSEFKPMPSGHYNRRSLSSERAAAAEKSRFF